MNSDPYAPPEWDMESGAIRRARRPPIPLIVASVAYLGLEAILLVMRPSVVVAGRLALSILLFVFVLRGSRMAGNILAVLCGLSALIVLFAAVSAFPVSAAMGIALVVIAGLLLLFAGYLFLSPAVRAFQGISS